MNYKLNGLEFGDDDIIHFPGGLPGFEGLKKFILTASPEHEPFVWLHSIDNPQIRFVLVNPLLFRPDYDPTMSKDSLADLDIRNREDLHLYAIVTIHPDPRKSTANLAGPVLVNIKARLGKQLILEDSRFSVRDPILSGEEA